MGRRGILTVTLVAGLALLGSSGMANAFCGIIQKSATAETTKRVLKTIDRQIRRDVRQLRQQHGSKLVLDPQQKSCVGGALSIDAKGVQHVGQPSCTVTQAFCVNP